MKPLLLCDIDLTVVRSDIAWIDYIDSILFDNTGEAFSRIDQFYKVNNYVPYDITTLFAEAEERNIDLFDFWRDSHMYDSLVPVDGSVEALRRLSKEFDVMFISQAKGYHHKSKYYWIERHFPFHSGVCLTKEKWQVARGASVIIDDRPDILARCKEYNPSIVTVLVPTKHNRLDDHVVNTILDSWEELL